jgi:hypothetical protein
MRFAMRRPPRGEVVDDIVEQHVVSHGGHLL